MLLLNCMCMRRDELKKEIFNFPAEFRGNIGFDRFKLKKNSLIVSIKPTV